MTTQDDHQNADRPAVPAREPHFQPKILTTMRTYDWPTFGADLMAGLTVALVALPLAMAIAIASGAHPSTGLTTAVVAGFLISALGGSRVQIGGPTGAFIVVVYSIVQTHGYDGLVTATFMAGIILLVTGWFRVGSLIRHVPEAVINGFTVGIAIIIATSQLADAGGFTLSAALPAEFIGKIAGLWAARETITPAAVILTIVSAIGIIAMRRLFPRLPGMIVIIIAASIAVQLLGLPVDTVGSRFGSIAAGLPMPQLPDLSYGKIVELLPSALIIAFLAGIESLLSAIVADRMAGSRHRPNAEIVAQGVANTASALFGGLPATGAIARTATNVRAGGKTPVAGMAHAIFLLMFMLIASPLAAYLPMPALAALLLITAWNMAEVPHFIEQLKPRHRLSDRVILLMTAVLTVLVDLTFAIGLGIAAGLAMRLSRRKAREAPWDVGDR